jgi:FSR family fosmidomycin resistance protein-like MFS transporter
MSGCRSKVISYSIAHALVDMACAVLFFGFLRYGETGWICMVLYNAFAFAFQLPIGILADKLDRNSLFAGIGCALVALAFAFVKVPVLAAVIAGIGNGAFHVGGGIDVMNSSQGKAGPLGVFVSPGAIGLFIGKFFADTFASYPAMPAVMICCGLVLVFSTWNGRTFKSGNAPISFEIPKGGVLALAALFLVVVLRSYLGFTKAFSTGEYLSALPPFWAGFVPVLCLALGKAAGGYAADLFGARPTSIVTLGVCALMLFFPLHPLLALAALFLFNFTMPITLNEASKLLPGLKGGAFGLLTFALFIGVIPSFLGLETPALPVLFGGLALVSLLLLMLGIRRKKA